MYYFTILKLFSYFSKQLGFKIVKIHCFYDWSDPKIIKRKNCKSGFCDFQS